MDGASSRLAAALEGRYRFERELGAGGMATVYLAADLRHDRKVAIKVLRPELAAVLGAERFLQEIKTTANLQHPHILGLIDSGETAHQLWYVMPFVQGESLRERLTRERQLPVPDAVRLASEVASALDYAHRHGVVHRDIKPENILLHDGNALVVDFGIALAASRAGGSRMTETGMSMGTPAYMSPEQAMGDRDVTARSDVYALGAVLYEMLTGAPPFTGPTPQAIVARVLTGAPAPLSTMRKTIPRHVESAVLQALETLAADRFASAAEFAAALANPAFTATRPVAAATARSRTRATALLPWTLLVAAVGFIAVDQLRPRSSDPPPAVQRFDILLPENARWVGDIFSGMALSPDGRMLAYNGQDSSGHRRLFLRPLDQRDPSPIPESGNGQFPFFAPDGRWVAYRIGNRMVKSPVSGGPAVTVCETSGAGYGTWLESNDVVVTDSIGLRRCSMAGRVANLLPVDSMEKFSFPHGLPADRGVVFTIQRGAENRLAVLDLQTGQVKPLDIPGSDPRYVTTGHLVYTSPEGLVHAVPFDVRRLAITGEPIVIAEGVRVDFGVAVMGLSRTGAMVLAPGGSQQRALELVDRAGRAERLHAQLGDFSGPRFSPDGRRVALSIGTSIWMLDRVQGSLTRLTFDSSASRPSWSPTGKRLAYLRQEGRTTALRFVSADGSEPPQPVPGVRDLEPWEVLFGADDRSLLVRTVEQSGSRDLWLLALDSASAPVPLLRSPANETSPDLSPDGRWLAYVSDESGRPEVYVRSFPDMGGRFAVSLDGGTEPVWSPRGGELFYRSGEKMIAAQVRGGAAFDVVRRTLLFTSADHAVDVTHQAYDVAPDGQRFVMVRNLAADSRLTVTLNAFQNLEHGGTGGVPTSRPRRVLF